MTGMTNLDQADRQLLADWLGQYERFTASTYGSLDVPIELVREPKLNRIQAAINASLGRLNTILRSRSDAVRQSLANEHIAALRDIKLLRDDLFLVELEFLRRQRLALADRATRLAKIRENY